jgi:hypothetical protein
LEGLQKMKYLKNPLVGLLTVILTALVSVGTVNVGAQSQSSALERGYRTGYSDGYSSGAGDSTNKVARDYQNKEEYQRGDRSFNDAWGTIEEYKDGYQQGYEAGYGAGYDHQEFNSSIPTGLRRRQPGVISATVTTQPDVAAVANNNGDAPVVANNGSLSIPKDTVLTLELMSPLSTDITQPNDPFRARVTQPTEFANYIVEGRVIAVRRPGKVKGVAELQLSFEKISADNRTAALHAELVDVIPMSSNGPTDVDREGGIRGRDATKDDVTKVGAASGIGAIIGAIAGGGKGAAIGAIIGGGAGTAGVMTQRGHDIRLEQGQQIKIRTSTDTSTL